MSPAVLTAKGQEMALRGAFGGASRLLLRQGEIVRQIICVRWESPSKIVPIGGPVELVSGEVDNVQILTATGEILWSSSLDAAGVNTVSGRVHAGQLFYSWSPYLDGDTERDRVVLHRRDGSEVVLEAFQFKPAPGEPVSTDRDTASKPGRFAARGPGLLGVFRLLPPAADENGPDWHRALELLVCQGLCPWCVTKIEAVKIDPDVGLTWTCLERCNP